MTGFFHMGTLLDAASKPFQCLFRWHGVQHILQSGQEDYGLIRCFGLSGGHDKVGIDNVVESAGIEELAVLYFMYY